MIKYFDFENEIEKIDQLIKTIEKCTGCVKGDSKNLSNSVTSWTDVLIFIGLGIIAIFVIDMFFKFGKLIVTTQINNSLREPRQQIHLLNTQSKEGIFLIILNQLVLPQEVFKKYYKMRRRRRTPLRILIKT